ncbi:hypothetical protein QUF72_23190 [Desulfobacterales bacterium HSG2]|nr:hypothetical protein [Desulfobacterales bacterium HSG2]
MKNKWHISSIISVALLLVLCGRPAIAQNNRGDVDGNDSVELRDAILGLRLISGIVEYTDVTVNEKIELEKVIRILKILSGYSAEKTAEYCSVPENSIGTIRYTYDDLNRLVNVKYEIAEGDQGIEIGYVYDNTGNRKSEQVLCNSN